MENQTKKYTVNETVTLNKGVNLVGVRKNSDGKVIYLDPETKTRMLVTFAINPNKDDENHLPKYLDLVVDLEMGKKLKEAGLNLLEKKPAFCRLKYTIQDVYTKTDDGRTVIKSLYRVLRDVMVYDNDNSAWTDWLLKPTDSYASTSTADSMEVAVDDDDLPF